MNNSHLKELQSDLKNLSEPSKIPDYMRFFKTGEGEYGEGDVFIGVTVPNSRKIAVKYKDLSLKQVEELLHSKIHEERLVALLILVECFKNCDRESPCHADKKRIFDFYLANTKYVNNWDLVDLTAHKIVGAYLYNQPKHVTRSLLVSLSKSKSLWERRISIISTAFFISNNEFAETLVISEILLHDEHDLIHKAVGWMLREIGKKDQKVEERFLKKHYKSMPRTMLRYAIEKFPENLRQSYLKGTI